jgi:phage shock protein C
MNEPKILGVCVWVANRFRLDLPGVRITFLLGTLLTAGKAIIVYLILYLVKPKNTEY